MKFLEEHPEVVEELREYLPPTRQSKDDVISTISTPQYQAALRSLSSALMSAANFNSIFANFGLNPTDGMTQLNRGDAIGAFLNALQAKADREKPETSTTDDASK